MARLIPRKQIEEQQNISSSLNIGQDVNVGNNAIISGSLFVSRSFFLGSDENDVSEITGSVFLTGSLEIDGELVFKGPEAILSATSSNTLLAVDTQRYAGILAKDFGANQPTLYVSSTDGDDTNDGRTIQYPLRTIKRAAQLSAPGYDGRYGFDTGSVSNGYVIKVQAGTYLEDNPVILPKNTTIWGAGLRITKINAKNPTEDLFYVNSGCYVAEVTMGGLRLFPDQINPERGFAIAFQPGAFITTSPYIQNCSQISNQDNSFTELYEEIPPGGGGLYVNGDVIDPDSPLASMVLDAYTQISPNGVGCLVNGRGFIQLVSFFNNFSYYAIRVNNGGHATLNNSNISFGLYGMYASGSRFISGSGGNIDARNRVRAGWSVVVDVLNRGIDALPSVTTLNTAEGIKTTQFTQSYLSGTSTASIDRANEVVSDFNLVSAIVENGTANFPTLLARSSNKGYGADSPYNILGAEQITSSIASASINDIGQVSSSFGVTLGIFANGTGSYVFKSNTEDVKTISGILPESATTVATDFVTGSVSSSFDTIISILKRGLTAIPKLVSNNSSSVYANTENIEPFSTGVSSSLSTVNYVSSSLSIVYNILANGTGSNIEDIPENHIQSYTIVNNNSSSYNFVGTGNNPDLVLFRGLTYKFYVSASDAIGGVDYPFWIRTKQIAGIDPTYDYNDGVINNGDSVGNITFSIPYDAPDELFYVSQPNSNLGGKLKIINSSTTPRDLIESTLTFPATILSSSAASNNVDIINAYDILINNKEFIKEEVITFLSSSWSNFDYNETTCKRDVGYIIDGAAKDLLFGGNEESIRSGLFYYQYPSEATTIQKDPTLTAIKYASRLIDNLLRNKTFSLPNSDNESATSAIFDNREFIQNETITYLSSSWSTFEYNQEKCKRDVGYILDAVATDLKYGGNERSIEAGRFYYLYPSEAITTQVNQTVDGIKYAAGLVKNIILNKTFTTASQSTKEAYDLIRNNKSLIQNETIEFINVAFPTLDYNTTKCRRDVGFILDGVATDLLYGGNERSVASGRYYYDFPSIATSIQKVETSGGIRYTKIITEYIIQNLILDTPRIIYNDEKNIKVTALNNVTSSLSGSQVESALISSSFNIVEGIIKRGIESISSIIAQNTNTNWSISNPVKVSSTNQITNSFAIPNENYIIDTNFEVVTNIIANGIGSLPTLTSSIDGLIKVSNEIQYTGSSATNAETASISSSMVDIINVIINGTGSLQPYVSNVNSNIKVTNTTFTTSTSATGLESASISSSMEIIKNVLNNGLSVLPNLVQNTSASIKVTNTNQYISSSYSASASDVSFISASISIVTDIISRGYDVAPNIQPYTNRLTASNSVAAYEILKNNIPFIQNETIAYLSSSWAGFEYDEAKCKRDLGFILSGSAEDLIWNSNSASVVNGLYYYDFPSQATDSQLQQTLDGINYASKLAQKVIQNVVFQNADINKIRAKNLLINNKEFIQNETIAYISSSWSVFEYNQTTCKRDVGYILDAVATDLVYGGNERVREAGRFYYLYPSEATGTQLIQTTDAINYASRIAQKIVVGQTFTLADSNKLNASNLLLANQNLIAEEVVAYVSSSWSGVYYNENKCKRDTKYILDAVRTDLVYGGTERSRVAGLFYYLYPSSATVAGVPSPTNQLDMTVTGLQYASQLAQKIVLNNILEAPIQSIIDAASLIRNDIPFIQENVIEYTNETYPNLNYIQSKCFRDVRFIVDAVVTDLVYGGNERSRTAGYFYYLYPSQATDDQLNETIDAINFGRDLTKLVSIGGLEVERGFDIVGNIIASGSSAKPTIISNTQQGIRATNQTQITSSNDISLVDKNIVSSSFGNVINIIANGTGSLPTIVSSSFRGVLISGGSQITSSLTPSAGDINKVSTGFDLVVGIVSNGTGSIPALVTNATGSIKRTNSSQYITTASISETHINSTKNAFDTVLNIVANGTSSLPSLVRNTNGLVKITGVNEFYNTASISRTFVNNITSSFDRIINILRSGVNTIPTIVSNTSGNIKVTNTQQYIGGSPATNVEASIISASIGIVANIVNNGTSVTPTIIEYVSQSTNPNVLAAYNILKNNIPFIQNETIAYLSSSWSTASYNEEKCKRDVGFILSGSAEDLLWGANSASVVNGVYYYDFPSLAETAQLNQTLDGIKYASKLAQKVVLNTMFQTASVQVVDAYNTIRNNRTFIQSESIAYISSSWSTHQYNETTCKRDISYILDAISTDALYGGNERTITAGIYYYLYPSEATGSQLDETITGINYAKNLTDRLLKNATFQIVTNNKLQAKDLIVSNKNFIANEVIAYVSASWNGFEYNEASCSRDIAYILDAVATDMVYGGNERSIEAGRFYYDYPSEATTIQLGPTLSGIKHAKGLTQQILKNVLFATASNSAKTAYQLLLNNKELIQDETIAFVSSSWSMFNYNDVKCRRDVGYIVDAVATDILYGGNERVSEAGEYYYLYPSLATVEGDGNESGQLDQTLDGIKYAKGISQKIVSNQLLQTASISEITGWNLLRKNKQLIQKETIAYLSSSWTGVDGFYYNEVSCSRDIAYIIDNVATDLLYGGNERSSKAGEYYYLYPSKAIVKGVPSVNAQLEQTLDGIRYVAGISENVISNKLLIEPTLFISSSVSLMKQNRTFIQNETIQYIDAFFPDLVYNREKCRRDVGYIVDNVSTDLFYGGNQRSIIAGDYYYKYPSLATKQEQVRETVAGVDYAKNVSRKVVQNILLESPVLFKNTDYNIKATNTNQYTSSISVSTTEISKISSSFSIVTDIIAGGVEVSPIKVLNTDGAIKVTNETPITSSINGASVYADLVTSSFNLVRDIIYYGEAGIPDALARNYDYGFQLSIPTLLHISSIEQSVIAGTNNASDLVDVSASYATIINIVNNGTGSIPTIIENTSSSINVIGGTTYQSLQSGSISDINKIGTGFEIVTGIIEGTYPTIVSNNTNGIKVTNTPQLISGSGADRIQSKIVSASFGVVTSILNSNTSSVKFVNSNAIPNSNSKINLAYNLLLGNKQMIIDETIAYMSSSWSTFDYNEASCRRDLGFIIDGAAYDLIYGGNSASFVNGKYYYDFPSQATGSQLDQTITAINYASGLAEKVVRNTTLAHISASQSTSASYVSLLKNKLFIQNEAIAYVSSSWMEFDYNEATCRRDIGYIIDAVATDLLYGGNERSWTAGDYYFRYPSQATTSQLQPTLDGINYAKGVAMNVAKNTTFVTADSNTQFSYDILLANKEFIQNETVAFVNAKYPNLYYDQIKCKRDVGYIVDAVATDLLYGGNERAAIAGEFYYLYPSLATEVEQVVETTAAIDYARRLSLAIIQKIVIPTPQVVSNTFNNIKVTNVPQINGVAATQVEATSISSSIGIVTNIVSNGTGSLPTIIPYTTSSTDPNVINAYNNLKANIAFIAAETVAYISSSWVTGSNSDTAFVYNDLSCSRDVSLIVSGAAEDLLWNSNSASVVNGKFYYEYPSQATNTQLDETLDGISYASQLAQKIVLNTLFVTASVSASAVYQALKINKPFIQAETIAFVSSSWNGLSYIESKCKRDVGLIVDAVATDILYGGNQRSATAGQYYFKYPSLATGSQLDSTLNAIDFAGGTAKNVITNATFVTASQSVSASVELLRNNRAFIQNETIAWLDSAWSFFEYNKEKCRRDVGYILDGVITDILYGGNERTVMSGEFYYKYPSKATLLGDGDGVGQLKQTNEGILYASRISQKIAQNVQFVTPSLEVSASFTLLRDNKDFIAAETIAYVSSSWSGVYYNEASCSRDVRYITDAAATDLLYGGTERSVTAGSYYFLFPSKATKAGVPSEANQLDPTVTGVRYAGRLASKSVLNPTYVNASIDNLNARRLLQTNKLFIQKETIAFLSSSWSTLKYNEVSCSRDLGFILDAVSTDLVYGGNERSIEAGSFYYKIPSVAIKPSYTDNGTVGQLKQTVDGINYAKGISEKIVNQTQLVFPQTRRREAYSRLISAKEELKQRAIGYTNGAFPYLVYNEASCSRDTGLIVDAVATDLLYGGNERSIAAASSYYTGQYGSAKAVINEQKLETLETNRYLRTRAEFVAAGAPVESFGSLIVATGIDYSYNGSGVTFKALPPNQGGSGVPNPIYEITELAGGRIYFTSGNQDGDFRIGTGLSINQATGTLVGRTFSKSLFSLVTPFSLALEG